MIRSRWLLLCANFRRAALLLAFLLTAAVGAVRATDAGPSAQSTQPPDPPQIDQDLVARFLDAVAHQNFDEAAAELKTAPALIDAPDQSLVGEIPLVYVQDASDDADILKRQMNFLLDHGAHVNQRWKGCLTALGNAVVFNHLEAARILLDHGAKIDFLVATRLCGPAVVTQGGIGATPLLVAMETGSDAMVELLVAHGADINAVDANGNGLMHYAVQVNPPLPAVELAYRLAPDSLDRPNKDGEAPLSLAIWDHDMRETQWFRAPDIARWQARDRPVIQFLLDHGADLKHCDASGATDLFYAVHARDFALVKRCIEAGIDPNVQATAKTPFMNPLAAMRHVPHTYPETALDLALGSYVPAIFKYLLDHGARSSGALLESGGVPTTLLNEATYLYPGETPPPGDGPAIELEPHDSALYLLLTHGWDPNQPDKNGETPLDIATLMQTSAPLKLLLRFGADPNRPGLRGFRPLDFAGNMESLDDVKVLLAHGAKPRLRNADGTTPLQAYLAQATHHDPFSGEDPGQFEPATHRPISQQLYAAQENGVNLALGLLLILGVPCLIWRLYALNRRRDAARLKAGPAPAPDAVWKDPNWRALAQQFERAEALHAAVLRNRRCLPLSLALFGLLCGLHWIDPLLWDETAAAGWWQMGVLGTTLLAAWLGLYLPWRRLHLAAALVGLGVTLYALPVFIIEGNRKVQIDWLYAAGGLLILGAVLLTPSLFQWARIAYMEAAILRLKLPYRVGAKPSQPAEAEPIEAQSGWDHAARPIQPAQPTQPTQQK